MELPTTSAPGLALTVRSWRRAVRVGSLLLLGLFGCGATLAQNISFVESNLFGTAGETLDFNILTDDGVNPTGGGTLNWIVDASCQGRVTLNNPPSSPNITGTTLASLTSQRRAQCFITVEWDHDNSAATPAITPPGDLFVGFAPLLSIELLSGSTGGVHIPVGSRPVYEVLIRDNGFPVDPGEAYIDIRVSSPFKGFFGGGCGPSSYFTGPGGIASFDFGNEVSLLPLLDATYQLEIEAQIFFGCRGDVARGSGTQGLPIAVPVNFVARTAELVLVTQPSQAIVGQPATFEARLQTPAFLPRNGVQGSALPFEGKQIDWDVSPPSIFAAPTTGNFVTDVDGRGTATVTATGTDFNGGFFSAVWNPPDGITGPVSASANFQVAQLGLQFQVNPSNVPVFTDETAPSFSVITTSDTGNGPDPVAGVPVTFTISSGNAVFLPDNVDSIQVMSDVNGIATTPNLLVGRTNQDVTVEVDAGTHGTLQANYLTTPSTYSMDFVAPAGGTATISQGEDISLSVALQRAGASVPNPMGAGEQVTWSIAPDDGSTLASPTASDSGGIATSLFTPIAATTYTVTASFDPGIGGVAPTQQAFTIDVLAGPGLLVSKNFAFSVDQGAPGFADEGDVIEYQVGIQNTGSTSATISSVLDSYQGGTPSPLAGCPAVLAAGASGSCTPYSHVVSVNDLGAATIDNTVSVSADFGAAGTVNQSATAQVPVATPSPFSLSIVAPAGGSAQITVNSSIDLIVLAEESGLPVTDGSVVVYSVVSGPAGFTLSPTNANTVNGQALASFTPSQVGTFGIHAELLASGTPRPAGAARVKRIDGFIPPNPVVVFTIDAIDVTRTLSKPAVGSGDGQSGAPGSTLPQPLVVIARDDGNPAANVNITWAVVGDATLDSNQTTTQADGSTSVVLTFGPSSGTVQVTATRDDDPTAQAGFVVTAIAQTLSVISGNDQAAASGEPLPEPLVVEARDDSLAVAGVDIEWVVVTGDAFISDSVTSTGPDGRSAVDVTLGQAGPVLIEARRSDAPTAVANFALSSLALNETLQRVAGDGQTGTLTLDGQALSVRFLRGDVVVAGETVTWQVLEGDATLVPTSSQTDAAGIASTVPRFGTTPGTVRVRASAGSADPVDFIIEVAAPQLRLLAGGGQSGPFGTRAADALVVGLFDACCDAPIGGVAINWQVVSGDATLDAPISNTDAAGHAQNGFSFGTSGNLTIRASALGGLVSIDIPGFSFTPGISIHSGDAQTGLVSTQLAEDLVVRLSQPNASKSFGGIAIQWQVIEGNGSVMSFSSLTDAKGLARNQLTLGPDAGLNRVTASIAGGDSVTFVATGELPTGSLVRVSGDGQTLPTGVDSAPLVVELRDASGAPLSNQTLLWSGDNVELQTSSSVTDAQGRAENVARVLIPGSAIVAVSAQRLEAGSVSFSMNGGIANIPTLSPAQRQVGRALDSACELLTALTTARTAEEEDLLARCLELAANSGGNPQGVQEALNELSNDIGAAQVNAAFISLRGQFGNIQRRLTTLRSNSRSGFDISGLGLQTSTGALSLGLLGSDEPEAETGADFGRWSFFASGSIGSGQQDTTGQNSGFKFDTSGLTAGVDYRVNPQAFVGAAIGFNQQDSDFRNGRGGMDTSGFSLTGYASWYNEKNWYVDGVLTLGRNDYQVSRHIDYSIPALGGGITQVDQTARGDASGDLTSFSVSTGRDFQKGAWSYGGYVRGSIARADIDAYNERMSGSGPGTGLGLAVEQRSFESQTATLGGRLSYTSSRDWGILTPSLQFEWEHELRDDPERLVSSFIHDPGNTQVVVDGDPLDRDYFNVGVGLSAIFPGGRSAFVFYEQLMGRSMQKQGTLSLGVRIEF